LPLLLYISFFHILLAPLLSIRYTISSAYASPLLILLLRHAIDYLFLFLFFHFLSFGRRLLIFIFIIDYYFRHWLRHYFHYFLRHYYAFDWYFAITPLRSMLLPLYYAIDYAYWYYSFSLLIITDIHIYFSFRHYFAIIDAIDILILLLHYWCHDIIIDYNRYSHYYYIDIAISWLADYWYFIIIIAIDTLILLLIHYYWLIIDISLAISHYWYVITFISMPLLILITIDYLASDTLAIDYLRHYFIDFDYYATYYWLHYYWYYFIIDAIHYYAI